MRDRGWMWKMKSTIDKPDRIRSFSRSTILVLQYIQTLTLGTVWLVSLLSVQVHQCIEVVLRAGPKNYRSACICDPIMNDPIKSIGIKRCPTCTMRYNLPGALSDGVPQLIGSLSFYLLGCRLYLQYTTHTGWDAIRCS